MDSKEKTIRTVDTSESCATHIHDASCQAGGIVQVDLDLEQEKVALTYDPRRITQQEVSEVADTILGSVRERQKDCSLRIGRRGGRACESCAAILERRIQSVPGVRHATISFRSGLLKVAYDETVLPGDELLELVRKLGVTTASEARSPEIVRGSKAIPAGSFLTKLFSRFANIPVEAIFTLVTLAAMTLGLIAEKTNTHALWITLSYSIAYVSGGIFGVKAGLQSLRHLTVDIDLLMILAAIGAAVVGAPFEGAMLLFLFSLSNVLQDYALGRTRNAIKELMKLRLDQALVRHGDELVYLPIEHVEVGDVFILRPGDRIPLDGTVLTGESAVDQSSVTGESMPVDKTPGDKVFAGTINQYGFLEVRVRRLAKDSTLSKLIRMVEEAQSEKAETQRFIDRAEQNYAMGVIAFTILAILVPILLLNEAFQPAFYRAMTIMVAASPCALVISTPATILSAIGNGARRGVLFKGGAHVEQAATIRVVAFDKTGTLTVGRPEVTFIKAIPGAFWSGDDNELLSLAAAVQFRSEHVLAQAVVEAARRRSVPVPEATSFQAVAGKGVWARVQNTEVHIGNPRYYEDFQQIGFEAVQAEVVQLQEEGKTCVIVALALQDSDTLHPVGIIGFSDILRPGVADVVARMKSFGVERVVMLTGDNHRVAAEIARQAGIDAYYAELLPEDKLRLLKEMEEQYGPVAMVGDGVNDAPALAAASIGIAMGAAGTDVALETADIVLMSDELENIPYVIALSHKTRRTLVVNLGFAFAMILLMIGMIFSARLPLPLAVIGHEGSTVLVSLNGLRLLGFRYRTGR